MFSARHVGHHLHTARAHQVHLQLNTTTKSFDALFSFIFFRRVVRQELGRDFFNGCGPANTRSHRARKTHGKGNVHELQDRTRRKRRRVNALQMRRTHHVHEATRYIPFYYMTRVQGPGFSRSFADRRAPPTREHNRIVTAPTRRKTRLPRILHVHVRNTFHTGQFFLHVQRSKSAVRSSNHLVRPAHKGDQSDDLFRQFGARAHGVNGKISTPHVRSFLREEPGTKGTAR